MSKGLEALKKIKTSFNTNCLWAQESCNVIEKELKALVIIKTKAVNVDDLYACIKTEVYPLQMYNKSHKKLTQEEYDLLKEVLL